MNVLNFGCNMFKLPGFINIDIDPNNKPDLIMDIMEIDSHYQPNSVDFVHAGHFFEHISAENGALLMKKVYKLLKPYSSIVITIPDYSKAAVSETIENAERIILNYGNHVALYNLSRMEKIAREAGFRLFTEVELERIPWMVLPAGENPTPEKWQTSFLAMKT